MKTKQVSFKIVHHIYPFKNKLGWIYSVYGPVMYILWIKRGNNLSFVCELYTYEKYSGLILEIILVAKQEKQSRFQERTKF